MATLGHSGAETPVNSNSGDQHAHGSHNQGLGIHTVVPNDTSSSEGAGSHASSSSVTGPSSNATTGNVVSSELDVNVLIISWNSNKLTESNWA